MIKKLHHNHVELQLKTSTDPSRIAQQNLIQISNQQQQFEIINPCQIKKQNTQEKVIQNKSNNLYTQIFNPYFSDILKKTKSSNTKGLLTQTQKQSIIVKKTNQQTYNRIKKKITESGNLNHQKIITRDLVLRQYPKGQKYQKIALNFTNFIIIDSREQERARPKTTIKSRKCIQQLLIKNRSNNRINEYHLKTLQGGELRQKINNESIYKSKFLKAVSPQKLKQNNSRQIYQQSNKLHNRLLQILKYSTKIHNLYHSPLKIRKKYLK